MKKTNLLKAAFCLLTIIALNSSNAQGTSTPGQGPDINFSDLGLNGETGVKVRGETSLKNIDVFTLRYRTSTLDLRKINQFTKYTVPESIVITPPDLSRYDHTVALIGLYGSYNNPNIIIWLAGNYDYNKVSFHLDYDQDRNFTDDAKVIRMSRGDKPVEVTLTPKEGPIKLFLSVPENKVRSTVNKNKLKVINRPVFGIQAGIGSGDLEYGYIDDLADETVDYYVNVSEKNFGISGSYYFSKAIVGVSAIYQNHYHYASYILLDGEPTTLVNRDSHSPNKVQMGLFAAYRQSLGQFVEIQPLVRYGFAQYTNPEYVPNATDDIGYRLEPSQFLEYGFRFEFTVGIENLFFMEVVRNKQEWQPLEMPGTNTESFDSRVKVTKMNVGFSVPLGN